MTVRLLLKSFNVFRRNASRIRAAWRLAPKSVRDLCKDAIVDVGKQIGKYELSASGQNHEEIIKKPLDGTETLDALIEEIQEYTRRSRSTSQSFTRIAGLRMCTTLVVAAYHRIRRQQRMTAKTREPLPEPAVEVSAHDHSSPAPLEPCKTVLGGKAVEQSAEHGVQSVLGRNPRKCLKAKYTRSRWAVASAANKSPLQRRTFKLTLTGGVGLLVSNSYRASAPLRMPWTLRHFRLRQRKC